ncbi:MAG: hypothetical protein JXN59_02080 [Anaerolineae bacterium]|nr:hypothetical protein [Anaerolineae bacterium]
MASIDPQNQNQRVADFLLDYVDEVASLPTLLQQYSLAHNDVRDLVYLTDQLRMALIAIDPSPEFVAQLLAEFADYRADRPWWSRVPSVPVRLPAIREFQHMSNRTKLAAGLGGITLVYLTARSLSYILSLRQQDHQSENMVA